MSNQITNEMLNYLLSNGMINIADVQEEMYMAKRKEILKKHPFSVWLGTDSKWHTYLPDEEKGRIHRKRATKKEIEDLIVKHYEDLEKTPKTFNDVYWNWRTIQDSGVSDNTIAKYNTDYRRYFENTDFANKAIEKITSEDIKFHMNITIKKLHLCKGACKTFFWYIKKVLISAKVNKLITEVPTEYLSASNFYPICFEKNRPLDKILVSNDEMKMLYSKFKEDYEENASYIVTYAVEFASLTGMRVGEISALRWDAIQNGKIIIDKSEKWNKLTKEYFIDRTKNHKVREFPITPQIQDLLDRVKRAELKQGYICDWVFANENGRIHANVISSCSKNKCRQVGITDKGIHAYRRTLNSKMRKNGVSAVTASSLLGHSEDVNEKYYTFDISTDEEKMDIITKINKKTCG